MRKTPVYYRNRKTGKIEGKFIGCDTSSTMFRNKELYERFESDQDLPLGVQAAPSPEGKLVAAPPVEKKPLWRRLLHL